MIGYRINSSCALTKVWNTTAGTKGYVVGTPTVANGVVYYGDGFGGTEYAFNAGTGEVLWNSGSQINGSIYAAPTVVNGEVLVGAWNGVLYAFGT
jgi:outer membrane protein assembly factor BamB